MRPINIYQGGILDKVVEATAGDKEVDRLAVRLDRLAALIEPINTQLETIARRVSRVEKKVDALVGGVAAKGETALEPTVQSIARRVSRIERRVERLAGIPAQDLTHVVGLLDAISAHLGLVPVVEEAMAELVDAADVADAVVVPPEPPAPEPPVSEISTVSSADVKLPNAAALVAALTGQQTSPPPVPKVKSQSQPKPAEHPPRSRVDAMLEQVFNVLSR